MFIERAAVFRISDLRLNIIIYKSLFKSHYYLPIFRKFQGSFNYSNTLMKPDSHIIAWQQTALAASLTNYRFLSDFNKDSVAYDDNHPNVSTTKK